MPAEPIEKPRLFTRRALVQLIVPLVVEQFLVMAVGMAGTIMVSSAGEAAVSGLSLVDAINLLLIQIFSALATGGAVVAAQYIGQGDRKNACVSAKQLLYSITFLATIFTIFCLSFQNHILSFVFGNIDPQVMANAKVYFWLSAMSYPFLAVYNACAALYRSMGNSKISMFTAFIMNIINVVINAVLIYGYGLGVLGAAIASLVSRAVAAVIMMMLIRNRNNLIYIEHALQFEFRPRMIKNILKIGIPNGLENGMFQIGKLIVQSLVATFGTAAIAANAIDNSVTSLANIPGIAVGLAMITVVGQCIGYGDYEQAAYYTKKLMGVIYVSMGILDAGLLIFAVPLVGLFNLEPAATQTAIEILRIFAVCNFLLWPVSFPFANTLRAAGDAKYPMTISILSMWIFRIGFSYVLAKYLGLGVQGTWLAMYVDWVVRASFFLHRYKSGKWKNFSVI